MRKRSSVEIIVSPVDSKDDKENISYCANLIQQSFGNMFANHEREDINFFKERVRKKIENGSIFYVLSLPGLLAGKKNMPIGIFELAPIKLLTPHGRELGEAAFLKNVCIDKPIQGQGFGKNLLQEVDRIARQKQFPFILSYVAKLNLLGSFYKNGQRISGLMANTFYLGQDIEPIISAVDLDSKPSPSGIYQRRRHSFSGNMEPPSQQSPQPQLN